ncbi:MAG: PrsW family intramembrane metalloprotease [Candidatus Bathyarchaeota archaeon]|nr:PrsW family intramembrane metalloprotease [Candidatus Bathyarchaeota archaeon]
MNRPEIIIQLHKPSVSEKLFFVLSGAIVSVPLTLFLMQNFGAPLVSGFSGFVITVVTIAILTPFIEEFAKVFPLFYRHGETQRSIFTLALCVGLGFGIVEFLTYVFSYGANLIPNRIPGLLFHPASTSITAYGIATHKPLPYYLAAVSLHFSNNFFVVVAPTVPSSVVVLAITVFVSWMLHGRAKEKFIENDYATVKKMVSPEEIS